MRSRAKLFNWNGRAALVLYLVLQDSKCFNGCCYSTPLWEQVAFTEKQGTETLQILDFSVRVRCFQYWYFQNVGLMGVSFSKSSPALSDYYWYFHRTAPLFSSQRPRWMTLYENLCQNGLCLGWFSALWPALRLLEFQWPTLISQVGFYCVLKSHSYYLNVSGYLDRKNQVAFLY